MNSAEGNPGFLNQFKGKAALLINTTVGCGNAGQLEPISWIHEKYKGDDFTVIAIPTNDYCGPQITKGKWADGITCGLDSKNYSEDVYQTTFPYSEMITSNPGDIPAHEPYLGLGSGLNGLGQPFGERHALYLEVCNQTRDAYMEKRKQGIEERKDYYSKVLNQHDSGFLMNCNFEKYLIDKDGYVVKHYPCTTLNYKIERTWQEELTRTGRGEASIGSGRSMLDFEEEYAVITGHIERLINGERSIINPLAVLV